MSCVVYAAIALLHPPKRLHETNDDVLQLDVNYHVAKTYFPLELFSVYYTFSQFMLANLLIISGYITNLEFVHNCTFALTKKHKIVIGPSAVMKSLSLAVVKSLSF